jgi:DNA polymerase-1
MPTYKNNRNASTVPTLVDVLKNYMKKAHPCWIYEGLEADDVMSLMQTNDTIICTIDKDLDQVEGLHYNWNKIGVYEITEEEGTKFFYRQILMGDPTDGYKGCPKIGKVKSQRIVDDFYERGLSEAEMWKEIVDIYYNNMIRYTDENTTYIGAEMSALENARVARMLRGNEYTFETSAVHYWLPEGGAIADHG